MYILYENGERIILIKTLIPKMHLNMTLLDLCVSAKMGARNGPGLSMAFRCGQNYTDSKNILKT